MATSNTQYPSRGGRGELDQKIPRPMRAKARTPSQWTTTSYPGVAPFPIMSSETALSETTSAVAHTERFPRKSGATPEVILGQ